MICLTGAFNGNPFKNRMKKKQVEIKSCGDGNKRISSYLLGSTYRIKFVFLSMIY